MSESNQFIFCNILGLQDVEIENTDTLLSMAEQRFLNNPEFYSKALKTHLPPASATVKNIAIHCRSVCNGGIERVVVTLLEKFVSHEKSPYRFVLLTDTPEEDGEYELPAGISRYTLPENYPARTETLSKILAEEQIDLYWEHCYYRYEHIPKDLLLCQLMRIRIAIHIHSVCSGLIAQAEIPCAYLQKFHRLTDILFVLSRMDERFFRTIGFPACYIPNPVTFPNNSLVSDCTSNNLLWVGRISDEKRPLDAVHIFAKAHKQNPDLTLTVVGGQDDGLKKKMVDLIKEYGIESSVTLTGYQVDTKPFYQNAALLMLTSKNEGFPMVILEAKSFGVPVIHYDFPYLETLQAGSGSCAVAQQDIDGAAQKIADLTLEPERIQLKNLSLQARKCYEEFVSIDLVEEYKKSFGILEQHGFYPYSAPESWTGQQAAILLKTLNYHIDLCMDNMQKYVDMRMADAAQHYNNVRMKEHKTLILENEKLKEQMDFLLNHSVSYRIGKVLMWLPQKIVNWLKEKKNA